jgi:hypothetical protein
LYDLAHDVGPIPVGIALSVAAYLLGSVSQALSRAVTRPVSAARLRWVPGRTQKTDDIADFEKRGGRRLEFLQTVQSGPGADHLTDSIEIGCDNIENQIDGYSNRDLKIKSQLYTELRERVHGAGIAIEHELSLPATLLVGDRPELFAEVDRLRSEGELRLTVIPPITAILILFAAQASPIWLVSCLPILILSVQGIRRQQDARRIIADAMRIGSVQSSAAARFDEWVKFIPERITELDARFAQREHESELEDRWFIREIGESGEKALKAVVKSLSNDKSSHQNRTTASGN